MSENRFGDPPVNGAQVAMTNTGSAITPYRVTVTKNGRLIKDEEFTLKADAQRFHDQQWAEINASRP
jgi:hypothetical protein